MASEQTALISNGMLSNLDQIEDNRKTTNTKLLS